ncbi:hypothetical protein ACWCPG_32875, partial [Streptomyces sp. NPDC001919]
MIRDHPRDQAFFPAHRRCGTPAPPSRPAARRGRRAEGADAAGRARRNGAAEPDVLALETVPDVVEAEALLRAVEDCGIP